MFKRQSVVFARARKIGVCASIFFMVLADSASLARSEELKSKEPKGKEPKVEKPGLYTDKTPGEILKQYGSAVVMIAGVDEKGRPFELGNGFIVEETGVIVTAAQVILDQYPLFIKTFDGQVFWDILVIHCSPEHDFAVLKVNGFKLPVVSDADFENRDLRDADQLLTVKAGQPVAVIANPHGFAPVVSDSRITGLRVPKKKMGTPYQLSPETPEASPVEEDPAKVVSEGPLDLKHFDGSYDKEKALFELEWALVKNYRGGPVFNLRGRLLGIAMEEAVGNYGVRVAIPAALALSFAHEKPQMTIEELNHKSGEDIAAKESMLRGFYRPVEVDLEKGFYVYKDSEDEENRFFPEARRGDYGEVFFKEDSKDHPKSGSTCILIRYVDDFRSLLRKGSMGWKKPSWAGWAGYDLTGAHRIVFWARGARGGEKIERFQVGGLPDDLPDSCRAATGPVVLTKEWRQLSIDLFGQDMISVNNGFLWEANLADNPEGLTFYLDDIKFES